VLKCSIDGDLLGFSISKCECIGDGKKGTSEVF
jgi:hypothetical protein